MRRCKKKRKSSSRNRSRSRDCMCALKIYKDTHTLFGRLYYWQAERDLSGSSTHSRRTLQRSLCKELKKKKKKENFFFFFFFHGRLVKPVFFLSPFFIDYQYFMYYIWWRAACKTFSSPQRDGFIRSITVWRPRHFIFFFLPSLFVLV